jgi:Protein of unknown function (DUF3102)
MDTTTKPQAVAETLEQIGDRISKEYLAIVADEGRSNRTIVDRAIRVGKDLLNVKKSDKVPHGEWEKWVKNNLPQFNIRKVQRWMNLAENEAKIREEIAKRQGKNKNDTVSFLTLRQALAIANGSGDGGGNGGGDLYGGAETRLLKQLEPMNFDTADAAVTNTIRKLKAAVAQKKAA